jgi:hypothetical protein
MLSLAATTKTSLSIANGTTSHQSLASYVTSISLTAV